MLRRYFYFSISNTVLLHVKEIMNGKLIRINTQTTVAYLKILGPAVNKVIDHQIPTTGTRAGSYKNLGLVYDILQLSSIICLLLHLFILKSLK
jgi:hypothetical protein